jgi:hypothetical protein
MTNNIDLIDYMNKSDFTNITDIYWKHKDNNIYNKFVQYNKENIENKDIQINKRDIKIDKENVQIDKENVQIDKENVQIDKENVQIDKTKIDCKKVSKKDTKKEKKIKPLTFICDNLYIIEDDTNIQYIKNKLVDKISNKNYIKVFGVKKSSEIMSAIINNRWNMSLVLFLSFLFDKKIFYDKKEILFNKELTNIQILTI